MPDTADTTLRWTDPYGDSATIEGPDDRDPDGTFAILTLHPRDGDLPYGVYIDPGQAQAIIHELARRLTAAGHRLPDLQHLPR